MSYDIIILVLSLSVFLLLVTNLMQMNKNSELKIQLDSKIKELEDEKRVRNRVEKSKEDILTVTPGDHGILPDFPLIVTLDGGKKHNYSVTYEVEILEVSKDKYKVLATDFTSGDSYALDPKNKVGILNVINVKHPWVEKREFELIVDDSKRRDHKIDQILS